MTHSKEEEHLDIELTDDQLDSVSGGGKYDSHGHGYNSGNNCERTGTRGKKCQPD